MFVYSPWSEVVSVTTHGLPPPPPDPPRLLKSGARSLHLTWEPQTGFDTTSPSPFKPISRYQLEMQEGEARQHFKNVFDGEATAFVVEGLRRCSLYRFRLAASNADGMSHWSDIVAFRTDPDPPSVPKNLRVSGLNCLYWFDTNFSVTSPHKTRIHQAMLTGSVQANIHPQRKQIFTPMHVCLFANYVVFKKKANKSAIEMYRF